MLCAEFIFRTVLNDISGEKSIRSVVLNFLDKGKNRDIIFVGSSVFYDLYDDSEKVYNLGMDGANAYTGLEIMRRENVLPVVIFVEMGINAIMQSDGLHKEVMNLFKNRENTLLRRNVFYCSRKENNALLIIRTLARNVLTSKKERGLEYISDSHFKRALGMYVNRQETRVEKGYYENEKVVEYLKRKKELIDYFIEKGVIVYLVRAPSHDDMHRARLLEYEIEENIFPHNHYNWVNEDNAFVHKKTTDGIHLLREDSKRFISELMELVPAN